MPLRHDISQNYELKSAIEGLLGREAWLALKETTSVAAWRKQLGRALRAIELSIEASIRVRDEAWERQVAENLERGRRSIRAAKDIEGLISAFSATLLRQVFLQIGFLPERKRDASVRMRKEDWKLDVHRSAIYIQSPEQVERQFWLDQQRGIGVEEQRKLYDEHRISQSPLAYSRWCRGRDNA